MPTTAYKGRDGKVLISTNGGSTFVEIPGVRTTGMSGDNGPVDITNVSSAGWRELLTDAGVASIDVSIDGIVSTGTAFAALVAHMTGKTSGYFRVSFGNGGQMTGLFTVQNWTVTGAYNDAQTFQASLQSIGAPTIVAAT
ncbi:hypothetical protein HB662_01235 [Roseomonas frigidaquae]|uniref:Phage tail tube protein n=1 Tax=Falsiroseomonas frigidaquae TaxID=487318 RepID=A0ABX1ETB9_9PROT|nr:phage tail tube protein [Falsiroseomonas frigidaquae]NKE43383.1 hypothetical protein [Falsiroseomonas frigidaquae]